MPYVQYYIYVGSLEGLTKYLSMPTLHNSFIYLPTVGTRGALCNKLIHLQRPSMFELGDRFMGTPASIIKLIHSNW